MPAGYGDIPVVFRRDMGGSVFFPVTGNTRTLPVPVREISDGNTASIFRIFFRPVPLESGAETAGIGGNERRFLKDPVGSGCDNHRPG